MSTQHGSPDGPAKDDGLTQMAKGAEIVQELFENIRRAQSPGLAVSVIGTVAAVKDTARRVEQEFGGK